MTERAIDKMVEYLETCVTGCDTASEYAFRHILDKARRLALEEAKEKPVGQWTESELHAMLEDVVTVLDLSDSAIEKHGPLGTAPAQLVREVLAEKDLQIKMLKQGMISIPSPKERPTAPASLVEELADLEHRRWSSWQKYVHDLSPLNDKGERIIPKSSVEHWEKLIATDYKDLTDYSKGMDRKEVAKTLEVLSRYRPSSQADIVGDLKLLFDSWPGHQSIPTDEIQKIITKHEEAICKKN